MKILILKHEEETDLNNLMEWIKLRNNTFDVRSFSQNNKPLNHDYDLLIICGGDSDPDEEDKYPWLRDEKSFIKKAIEKKKFIVGLCLGAQLLSLSLGGKVFKSRHWEVGWHPVRLLEENEELIVFQWHQYQFVSPPGSLKIIENECTPDQGFKWGDKILALQFHPEATINWIKNAADKPTRPRENKYVQNGKEIIAGIHHQKKMQEWLYQQLDKLIS